MATPSLFGFGLPPWLAAITGMGGPPSAASLSAPRGGTAPVIPVQSAPLAPPSGGLPLGAGGPQSVTGQQINNFTAPWRTSPAQFPPPQGFAHFQIPQQSDLHAAPPDLSSGFVPPTVPKNLPQEASPKLTGNADVSGMGAMANLMPQVATAESGNGKASSNLGQFTKSTWDDFLKSSDGQGFTDADVNNPLAQHTAMAWRLMQGKQALAKAGLPATAQNVEATYMLGPNGGVAMAKADPTASAKQVYSQSAGKNIADQAFKENGSILQPGESAGQAMANIGNFYAGNALAKAQAASAAPASTPATPVPGQPVAAPAAQAPAPGPPAPGTQPNDYLQQAMKLANNAQSMMLNPAKYAHMIQPTWQQRALAFSSGFTDPTGTFGEAMANGSRNLLNFEMGDQKLGLQGLQGAGNVAMRDASMMAQIPMDMSLMDYRNKRTDGEAMAANHIAKEGVTDETEVMDAGENAITHVLPTISALKASLPASGFGPQWQDKAKRELANMFGLSIGNTTPTGTALAQMMAAQLRAGQLQHSRGGIVVRNQREFDSVMEAVANSDKNPQALMTALNLIQRSADFDKNVYNSWYSLSPRQQAQIRGTQNGFNAWYHPYVAKYGQSLGISANPNQPDQPTVTTSDGGQTYQTPNYNKGKTISAGGIDFQVH